MNSIEIKHLTKSFGDIKAVDDLSFTVEKGTFFNVIKLRVGSYQGIQTKCMPFLFSLDKSPKM